MGCDVPLFWLEAKYAALVRKDAVYLGLLDLSMLAKNCGRMDVVLLYWDNTEPKQLQCLADIFNKILDEESWMPDEFPQPGDKTWYFVPCRADWRPGRFHTLNHWVPAWHKDQLGQAQFDLRKAHAMAEVSSKQLGIMKQLAELSEKQTDNEEEADADAALLNSLMAEQAELEALEAFLQGVYSFDLSPELVPADGNCLLWSILALQNKGTGKQASKKDVKTLRQDTGGLLGNGFLCFFMFFMFVLFFLQ